jgi:hypothetical protein
MKKPAMIAAHYRKLTGLAADDVDDEENEY